jgi:hypothetical protein
MWAITTIMTTLRGHAPENVWLRAVYAAFLMFAINVWGGYFWGRWMSWFFKWFYGRSDSD